MTLSEIAAFVRFLGLGRSVGEWRKLRDGDRKKYMAKQERFQDISREMCMQMLALIRLDHYAF